MTAVADSAGNVVKRISYDLFGNIIEDTNDAFVVPFGFAGGLHDRDTGLVRFGYRDYDPDTGRWTAKDPIFFAGGDTDLYGYVLDNPVLLWDEAGLKGGILIPIRNFIKKNIKAGDMISPVIEQALSIPTSTFGVLLFDFFNPQDAGVTNESYLIYEWEKRHNVNKHDPHIQLPSIAKTLITEEDIWALRSEPCR